jgi:NAD(P)-dependent dehydrogenase (short-subunit alcohol dehydrogenase family)
VSEFLAAVPPASTAGAVILVTGASSGFGRATATTAAARGATVVGAFRGTRDGYDVTASELAETGIASVRLDVTDDASVAAAVTHVRERFGRIDAVVNMAGYGLLGPMECTPLEQTRRLFETNVYGTMRVCQAVVPIMREQGGGRIVNVGSDVGYRANYFQTSYAASKFAVDGFSQSMRLELRRFGIAVSLVSPGWYETEFGESVVTTFTAGEIAPLYADLIADWEAGVGAVEGPNHKPQEVADEIVDILADAQPRYRYPVGWNPERLGPVDIADIDRFQSHLVDYYRMDAPSLPAGR